MEQRWLAVAAMMLIAVALLGAVVASQLNTVQTSSISGEVMAVCTSTSFPQTESANGAFVCVPITQEVSATCTSNSFATGENSSGAFECAPVSQEVPATCTANSFATSENSTGAFKCAPVSWTGLTNFPSSCSAGSVVYGVGVTLSCTAAGGGNQEVSATCTGNSYAVNESSSGAFVCHVVQWTQLGNFPSNCAAGSVVYGVGITLSCTATGNPEVSATCTSNSFAVNESSSGAFVCAVVQWSQLGNFPSNCAAGSVVYGVGVTLSCTATGNPEVSATCTSNSYAVGESASGVFTCSVVGWNQLNNWPNACAAGSVVYGVTTTLSCTAQPIISSQCASGSVVFGITTTSINCTMETDVLSCPNYFITQNATTGIITTYGCNPAKPLFSGNNASVIIDSTINLCNHPCKILIGNGTYYIGNEYITPRNNVWLDGAGQWVTTLKLAAGVARPIMFDNTGFLYNFTVTNIGFNGNKYQQTDPASRISGELVLIAGKGNFAITFDQDSCYYARTGACLDLTAYNLQLSQSSIYNNGVTGAAFSSDSVHLGGANVTEYARIINNYINNSTDVGLAMDNVKASIISGNTISNGQTADATFDENSTADIISSNIFNETLYAGNWFAATPVQGTSAFNFTISSNNFYSNNQTATLNHQMVLINSARDFKFSSNYMVLSLHNSNDFAMTLVSDLNFQVDSNTIVSSTTSLQSSMIFFNGDSNYTAVANTLIGGSIGFQFATAASTNGNILDNTLMNVKTPFLYAVVPTNTQIINNYGYNPVGKITNFVYTTGGHFLAPWGTSSTLVASTTYTIEAMPQQLTCSGGTSVSITIYDSHGNVLVSGLTTLTLVTLQYGYQINFGAFTKAPTCVDSAT